MYHGYEARPGEHEIPPDRTENADDPVLAQQQPLLRRNTVVAPSSVQFDAGPLTAEPEPMRSPVGQPARERLATYDSGYNSLISTVATTPYLDGMAGQEPHRPRRPPSSVYSRTSIASEASLQGSSSIRATMSDL